MDWIQYVIQALPFISIWALIVINMRAQHKSNMFFYRALKTQLGRIIAIRSDMAVLEERIAALETPKKTTKPKKRMQ